MNLPSLLWWILLASPDGGDLPSAAREHNDRGVAAILAGDLDGGIAELERAYAAMPDPLAHRGGRGKVLGSLRSALRQRHDERGDPRDLCRLAELLAGHRDALRAVAGPERVAGTEAELRELEAELSAGAIDCDPPAAPPPPAAAPPPEVTPPAPPPRPAPPRPPPRATIAGAVLLPLGLAALAGSLAVLPAHVQTRSRGEHLRDRLVDAPCAAEDRAALTDLVSTARRQETAMAVLGSVGGALLVTGVALLVRGQRLQRRWRAAPGLAGLTLAGEF
jgi:hypothetical protein